MGAKMVWERVACPLCAQDDEEPILVVLGEADDSVYRVVRCRACGMGYLNPRPDAASLSLLYPEDYECYQSCDRREGWWPRLRDRLVRLGLSHYYGYPPPLTSWPEKVLARLAIPWLRRGRHTQTTLPFLGRGELLDFGCGSGAYARRLRDQGWRVTGLDFSMHAAQRARADHGLTVHIGTLPHPAIADNSQDVITMGCVLEHVPDPHRVVAAAARALRPGGALIITVPNLDSWGFRFFGRDWWPLELPRHLLHFTPATLRRLVEAHGLQVRELGIVPRASWMRRSCALARRRNWDGSVRAVLARLGRWRAVCSLLTRLSVLADCGDCLFLDARRPASSRQDLPRLAA